MAVQSTRFGLLWVEPINPSSLALLLAATMYNPFNTDPPPPLPLSLLATHFCLFVSSLGPELPAERPVRFPMPVLACFAAIWNHHAESTFLQSKAFGCSICLTVRVLAILRRQSWQSSLFLVIVDYTLQYREKMTCERWRALWERW